MVVVENGDVVLVGVVSAGFGGVKLFFLPRYRNIKYIMNDLHYMVLACSIHRGILWI